MPALRSRGWWLGFHSYFVFSRGWLARWPVSYKHAFGVAAVPRALVHASAVLVQFCAKS